MIWQVIAWNGQQKPVAAAIFLVLYAVAIATITTSTIRAIVTVTLRPAATMTVPSALSYIYKTKY